MTAAFPSQAEIREARRNQPVDGLDAIEAAHRDKIDAALAILNARHAEDASEVDMFVEAIAEHFQCPAMTSRHVRGRIEISYRELRRLVADLGGPVRTSGPAHVEPVKIQRGPGGRFAGRQS